MFNKPTKEMLKGALSEERIKAIERAKLMEEKKKQVILNERKKVLGELKSKEKKDVKHKFVLSVALIKLLVLIVCGIVLYLAFRYYF